MTILRSKALTSRTSRPIPDATVTRLPLYLRALVELLDTGVTTCSSDDLAKLVGTTSAQVRKDLSHLGSHGTRGVGYDVANLNATLRSAIGQDREWPIVVIGAGHLGAALAGYQGFDSRGVKVVAVVDTDPVKIGTRIGDVQISAPDDLGGIVRDGGIDIGIIATPPAAAQLAADALVGAGVHSILNFAPVHVTVPEGVDVRPVDVAAELQILGYHHRRRSDVNRAKEVPA